MSATHLTEHDDDPIVEEARDGAVSDDPLRTNLARGFTIVASILVALFVGAGWEWLMDRQDEAEYIERLVEEFRTGHVELRSDQEARRAAMRGSRRLLAAADSGLPAEDDSLRALSAALVEFRYFTPTHPALDELIAAGRLDFLRSSDLRQALMSYIQERDRLAVVEERERDFVAEQLEPYVVNAIEILPPPTPDDPDFWGPAVDREDLGRAVADPVFRSLLTVRIDRTDIALQFSVGLGRRIEAVLDELGADPDA